MSKFAIRLLTLTIYTMALVAVPTITPAKAAADGSQEMKKHKKTHKSLRIEQPRSSNHKSSNQAPPYANPNDNPDRKVSY
jgi:hypothetical protein